MSDTEIIAFNQNGEAFTYDRVKNAWRGAIAIWDILSQKYLNQNFDMQNPERIWELADNFRVARKDKIVLLSTFDKAIVRKRDFKELIEAFENFEGDTSLKEQANIIKKALQDKDITAIAWNQNDISCGFWLKVDNNDNIIGYNYNNENNHFWLFDDNSCLII